MLTDLEATISMIAAVWRHESERRSEMTLQIGDIAPDFEALTTEGRLRFHEWIGSSWAVLFSHPKNFTPVCTTELGYMAKLKPEFDRRNVKIIGLSVDPIDRHAMWPNDIQETQGLAPNYPMIGDPDLSISKAWGMLPAAANGDATKRAASDNQTVRNVFVVSPDQKIQLILVYPMTTGRNFDEVLRAIDSLQLTAKHKVATPVNWKPREDVIIAGSVTDDAARKIYAEGWKVPKPYIRIVPATAWLRQSNPPDLVFDSHGRARHQQKAEADENCEYWLRHDSAAHWRAGFRHRSVLARILRQPFPGSSGVARGRAGRVAAPLRRLVGGALRRRASRSQRLADILFEPRHRDERFLQGEALADAKSRLGAGSAGP
jgi:alkyl hydroperoxide reductase subunit AhpC